MSKFIKKSFGEKTYKKLKKAAKGIAVAAAVLFTAGAALPALAGIGKGMIGAAIKGTVAAGKGAIGLLGKGAAAVKGALTGGAAAGASPGAAGAAGSASAAIGATSPSVSYMVNGVAQAPIGAGVSGATQAAAGGGLKGFLMSPGGGMLAGTGLMAGGQFLATKGAAEDAAKSEREKIERYNQETNAYGYNRNGQHVGASGIDWRAALAPIEFTGAGLMQPQVQQQSIAPQTIDDLIAMRQRGIA